MYSLPARILSGLSPDADCSLSKLLLCGSRGVGGVAVAMDGVTSLELLDLEEDEEDDEEDEEFEEEG